MRNFDSNGVLIPVVAPASTELDAAYNYAKAADPNKEGLALSQLRSPASDASLQRMEQVVASLITAGKLTASTTQTQKGGSYRKYIWV